jgi:cytoskeletal protein CcmA (bactofilin family)
VTLSQTVSTEAEPTPAAREDDPAVARDLTMAVDLPREADDESSLPGYTVPEPTQSGSAGHAADGAETVLAAGANVEGMLRSDHSIRVAGSVQGEIESKQNVVVEEGARVQARIVAEQVTVLGEVNGSIECTGRVEIAASGRVTGEVSAGTLAIREGAFFEGHLKMVTRSEE